MNVLLDIEPYSRDRGVVTRWRSDYDLRVDAKGEVVISGNPEGLATLATHLMTLAQDGVPAGSHLHYDDLNGLEEGSATLILERKQAASGRFLSRDTWSGSPAAGQTQNRYSYLANDPLNGTDPSGHCGIDVIADIAFAGVSAAMLAFGPEKDRGTNALALGAFIAAARRAG